MEGMLNYFIPEDGDSSDHMNVVPLPRVDELKLAHIKKCFPLPGEFHFRFKTSFEGTYVWLDVTDDAERVPDFNGIIVSKIARIQRESSSRAAERVDAPIKKPTPAPIATAPDLIETSPPPQKREEVPAASPTSFHDDLVGLLADPVPAASPPSSSPPLTPPPVQPANDPFNLFMGSAAPAPMGVPMNARPAGAPNGAPPPGNFAPNAFPMGSMAPRPQGSIGISQMGQHMSMNKMATPQPANSFQGLQWQGMAPATLQQQQQQQQQQRGAGMGQRQW